MTILTRSTLPSSNWMKDWRTLYTLLESSTHKTPKTTTVTVGILIKKEWALSIGFVWLSLLLELRYWCTCLRKHRFSSSSNFSLLTDTIRELHSTWSQKAQAPSLNPSTRSNCSKMTIINKMPEIQRLSRNWQAFKEPLKEPRYMLYLWLSFIRRLWLSFRGSWLKASR